MDTKKLSDLAPNPKNPRRISPEKIEMLKKALARFGDISGIVFNRRSKQVVGGHQRRVAFDGGEIGIERTYDEPTPAGTVAEGCILYNGERFSYREVDWDDETELAANIAANKGAGEWDYTLLNEAISHLDHQNYDLELTMHDQAELERLVGGWQSDIEKIEKVSENLDGIAGKIVIKCKAEDAEELKLFLQGKILETAFEGVSFA